MSIQRIALIRTFENLLDQVESESLQDVQLHELEADLLAKVLDLGRQLLLYFLSMVVQRWSQNTFFLPPDTGAFAGKYRGKGKGSRNYQSVFGLVKIQRERYYNQQKKQSIFFMDQQLGLPENGMSYLLQSWLSQNSSQQVYAQSVELINTILGTNLQGMQAHRLIESIDKQVGTFYQEQKPVQQEFDDKSFACASFDGKGVPIRADETDRNVDSSAVKLSKGQKRGIKKEVTVSVNYTCERRIRSSDQVLNSFFSQGSSSTESLADIPKKEKEDKHLRGFLCGQYEAVTYGLEYFQKSTSADQKLVVLIDGNKGLEHAVDKASKELGIQNRIAAKILDFVHASEYIWKVANALLGEKHKDRTLWVKANCDMLLQGRVREIVQQWLVELSSERIRKSAGKHKLIQSAITYFENHLHMMAYDQYLYRGMPIATGVVESACGYFIGQRFDANGMRWSKKGVQSLIDLRAINLNGDWDIMIRKYIDNQQESLYGFYPKQIA